tara:strand:+ start:5042 stop:5647 length:606 start_codon:yes stop_codon:yes gene_type:complete
MSSTQRQLHKIKKIIGAVQKKYGRGLAIVEWEGNNPETGEPYGRAEIPIDDLDPQTKKIFLEKYCLSGKKRKYKKRKNLKRKHNEIVDDDIIPTTPNPWYPFKKPYRKSNSVDLSVIGNKIDSVPVVNILNESAESLLYLLEDKVQELIITNTYKEIQHNPLNKTEDILNKSREKIFELKKHVLKIREIILTGMNNTRVSL